MNVLVCGSRDWTDKAAIRRELTVLQPIDLLVEGGANGADKLSKEVADLLHIPVHEYLADWKRYGSNAGPMRNALMLANERIDLVLAFHESIFESKGTGDMVKKANHAGIEVRLFSK